MSKIYLKKPAPQDEPEENGQGGNGVEPDSKPNTAEKPAGRSSGFAFSPAALSQPAAPSQEVERTEDGNIKPVTGFDLRFRDLNISVAKTPAASSKKIQLSRPSEGAPGKIQLSRPSEGAPGKIQLSRPSEGAPKKLQLSRSNDEANRKLLLKKSLEAPVAERKLTLSRPGASGMNSAPDSSGNKERILIVDDEISILKVLSHILKTLGYEAVTTSSGEAALEKLNAQSFNLMITDLRLGSNMDGLDLLREARVVAPKMPVVMITAFASVKVAVQVLKEGAFDFVTKPFKMDVLTETVKSAISYGGMYSIESMAQQDMKLHFGKIVGEDPKMIEIFSLMKRVARTDATVLIQGEVGTGKAVFTEVLHQCSKRCEAPCITVNCSQVGSDELASVLFGSADGEYGVNGVFWAANGGTVFLSGAEKMSSIIQHKLLTLLQNKYVETPSGPLEVDVRIILASELSVKGMVADGRFIKELAMRICAFTLDLPPLRHRVHDIPHLVNFYCYQKSDELGFEITWDNDAMNKLLNYSWPGNIAELRKVLDGAMEKCQDGVLTEGMLPDHLAQAVVNHQTAMPVNPAMGKSLRSYLKGEASKSSALDGSRSLKNLTPGE